jgi:hypothetical protein
VETARDLARADPWRESLERSIARRARSRRAAAPEMPARPEQVPQARPEQVPRRQAWPEKARPRQAPPTQARPTEAWPNRVRASAHSCADVLWCLQAWGERAVAARTRVPAVGPRGIAMLALAAAIVASSLARGGAQGSPTPVRVDVARAAVTSTAPGPKVAAPGAGATGGCPLAVVPTGYVNPLANAVVKPERIDQGVDYAGSGTLTAIGPGRISYLATSNTGWPGAFIEYQLLAGADAGCYVFYAEGVIPVDGLRVGETLGAGQPIATIIPKYPTGIEVGWGGGTGTKAYAKIAGQWRPGDDQNNVATAAGKSFSALLDALGAPPGKVEG